MEQTFRILQQPGGWRFEAGLQRSMEMEHQTAPLNPVTGRTAVGAETVGRIIFVIVADRVPL